MTTDELVRLIEAEHARHRQHDPATAHPVSGCGVTIGDLSSRAGVARRAVEEAIQTARLEGTPIITDGGIRVAQDAEEEKALRDWLGARVRTQRLTIIRLWQGSRRRERERDATATPPAVLFPELDKAA